MDLFQGRMRAGQKNHFPEMKQLGRRSRDQEMSEMKRIKGPAEKTQPQS
jgi:hypothetical protein